MSVFKKIVNLPEYSRTNISSNLGPTLAGKIILNGPLVDYNGQISFINKNYCSVVSLTSVDDLSHAVFTIIGMNNGIKVIEKVTGPNNETMFTNNLFESIITIELDIDLVGGEDFTIGSGFSLAVTFDSYNIVTNASTLTYDIIFRQKEAANDWPAGSLMIWGISGQKPPLLLSSKLESDNCPANFSNIMHDLAAILTVAELKAGIVNDSAIPFEQIIVYINHTANNDSDCFLEIIQS